jgi:hypothetical protein
MAASQTMMQPTGWILSAAIPQRQWKDFENLFYFSVFLLLTYENWRI